MKVIIFQLVLTLLILDTYAQKVSNIRAEQRGQDIVVFYSLDTNLPCEVSLLLSQDNGLTWGSPLKNVSGDVGKNISAGEKQIVWKVLEEKEYLVGDKMKFKVIANGRKSFEPEMIFVQGGSFLMGSKYGSFSRAQRDESPVHSVTLSSFYLGKFEVTQAQWRAVMVNDPSDFSGCDNCPVENISWEDAQEYLQKLNALTAKNYRLPTEAEWEYAAKGGKASRGYTYSGSNDFWAVAWNFQNSGDKIHVVGTKQSNELGFCDMSGNVWEWCSDWYGEYSGSSLINPTGASSGEYRVLRGGSAYNQDVSMYRTSFRLANNPNTRLGDRGIRLVLPVE
jgi:formylglycine-generating enzyme required for sulfatase activity